MNARSFWFLFFFFNDTATTEIYTLSLHDALPICTAAGAQRPNTQGHQTGVGPAFFPQLPYQRDRKSTRLNSSHLVISYAVFCLKKKLFLDVPNRGPAFTGRLVHPDARRRHGSHLN